MGFFLQLNTKEDILKNAGNGYQVTKQLTVAIGKKILWKSMATVNCLLINILIKILQNYFSIQQKKELHMGLEQVEGE